MMNNNRGPASKEERDAILRRFGYEPVKLGLPKSWPWLLAGSLLGYAALIALVTFTAVTVLRCMGVLK